MSSIYSVSQINSYIKNMFAQDFALNKVSVKGEVSGCKYHPSGHIYFTLKDKGAAISAIMFAGKRSGLNFKLEDGKSVVVSGSIEVYERGGTYQIYASKIEEAGKGELYEEFLKLKEKLEDMGIFSEEYKQPIPSYVKRLGVVTASSGAALQDIINITKRRNPYMQLVLCAARVQGSGASREIVRAIKTLDELDLDCIIVGRGGGSIEDLWEFNKEEVAMAVFNAKTPIISAVGHETDFTIIDFAADLRAPTPSAAAELASCEIEDLFSEINGLSESLNSAEKRIVEKKRAELEKYMLKISAMSPENRLNSMRARNEELRSGLKYSISSKLSETKSGLTIRAEKLKALSPLTEITRGYAWVSGEEGEHIKNISQLKKDDKIELKMSGGSAKAKVTEVLHE